MFIHFFGLIYVSLKCLVIENDNFFLNNGVVCQRFICFNGIIFSQND